MSITRIVFPQQNTQLCGGLVNRFIQPTEWENVERVKSCALEPVPVVKYSCGDEVPQIHTYKTVDGERTVIKNLVPYVDRQAYKGIVELFAKPGECLYGLGQHEHGAYNYSGETQYLYQNNMKSPVPFFISSQGYGVLFDCQSTMVFCSEQGVVSMTLDVVDQIDFYIIEGENFDEIISQVRFLTGKACMMPLWSYGYVQSKEKYANQEELVSHAERFRELGIPIDCIVQDWKYWEGALWGEKLMDKQRYPDFGSAVRRLHELDVKLMVSIWPNFNVGGKNHAEFAEKNQLLGDYSTYDAFDEDARSTYWKQCEDELFSAGTDAWWCDNTEPFSSPDWCGEHKRSEKERYELVAGEHKKYLDGTLANAYCLEHAKGMYENWRKATDKRMVNLIRSAYIGIQQYGTVPWSGDISATWEVYAHQVAEGLSFCMSGMPYWTLDVGGFFTGSLKCWRKWKEDPEAEPVWFWAGDYDEGVADSDYCELYVRMLQYATFLTMMRSHGTDTPREPWHFPEPYRGVIEKYISMRYALLPYIYALGARTHFEDYTMHRSLMFDFAEDEKVRGICDQFMLGDLLVCPVMEPGATTREVYLPKGTSWQDCETGALYEGGQTIVANAPLEHMPLFARSGSIIVSTRGLQSCKGLKDAEYHITVHPGGDCAFTLYDDDGETYAYEKGEYSTTELAWHDSTRTLSIKKAEGKPTQRRFVANDKTACFTGQTIEIHL